MAVATSARDLPEGGLRVLYRRLTTDGTIGEPKGKPDPAFALPSAANWMRALRLLSVGQGLDFHAAVRFYAAAGVTPRAMSPQEENTVIEQLFLALHHLSALRALAATGQDTEFGRLGVLGWYHGSANAAAAMTAAQSGGFHEDHAKAHRSWDAAVAAPGLAMEPFGWRVPDLMGTTIAAEATALRGTSSGDLQHTPGSVADARGIAAQYLSGSAKWYAGRVEDKLLASPVFRSEGLTSFRTKAARTLRDQALAARGIGFMHQADRFRGKASYREALFLAYGSQPAVLLKGFLDDQAHVLQAFVAMAGAFAAARLGTATWAQFLDDADTRRAFALSPMAVWA